MIAMMGILPQKMRLHRSAFTLVELLIVVTIISFIAGALVVAARNVMVRAHKASTSALIQRLTTGAAIFCDDFGYYPPDDWPLRSDTECFTEKTPNPNDDNPSNIKLWPNANLILRLLYLYPPASVAGVESDMPSKQYVKLKESELKGGLTRSWVDKQSPNPAGRFESAFERDMSKPRKGLVVVDAWGRPLYYDCNTPARGPRLGAAPWPDRDAVIRPDVRMTFMGNVAPPIHNADGCDIFSCGADGRTSCNNSVDDNQDGRIDGADPLELGAEVGGIRISPLVGMAEDDINNWVGR